jgi:hypothetical protein
MSKSRRKSDDLTNSGYLSERMQMKLLQELEKSGPSEAVKIEEVANSETEPDDLQATTTRTSNRKRKASPPKTIDSEVIMDEKPNKRRGRSAKQVPLDEETEERSEGDLKTRVTQSSAVVKETQPKNAIKRRTLVMEEEERGPGPEPESKSIAPTNSKKERHSIKLLENDSIVSSRAGPASLGHSIALSSSIPTNSSSSSRPVQSNELSNSRSPLIIAPLDPPPPRLVQQQQPSQSKQLLQPPVISNPFDQLEIWTNELLEKIEKNKVSSFFLSVLLFARSLITLFLSCSGSFPCQIRSSGFSPQLQRERRTFFFFSVGEEFFNCFALNLFRSWFQWRRRRRNNAHCK